MENAFQNTEVHSDSLKASGWRSQMAKCRPVNKHSGGSRQTLAYLRLLVSNADVMLFLPESSHPESFKRFQQVSLNSTGRHLRQGEVWEAGGEM